MFGPTNCLQALKSVLAWLVAMLVIAQLAMLSKDWSCDPHEQDRPARDSGRWSAPCATNCSGVELDFEGFDNETGTPCGEYIVPNVVHFLRLGQRRINFVHCVCLMAALRHQRPDAIYMHTDVDRFSGRCWQRLVRTPAFRKVLQVRRIEAPVEIFGQTIRKRWRYFHGGDVTRIRILMTYGGIFLDNDSYIVRSLDDFRRYEMAIGWRPGKSLQNQVVVAHKSARFLRLWLESYRGAYQPLKWYYNAGMLPTTLVLERKPWLVHKVPNLFGNYGVLRRLYGQKWPEWRDYYAVHLQNRHTGKLRTVSGGLPIPVEFNETNVLVYPIAFRDMVLDVYPP